MHVPPCYPSFTCTHAEMDKTLDKKKKESNETVVNLIQNVLCVIYKICVLYVKLALIKETSI